MTFALGFGGWLAAAGLLAVVVVQHRLRVQTATSLARISHELRGPLTALGLALSSGGRGSRAVAGEGAGAADRGAVELELARVCAVLADLDALAAGGMSAPGAPRTLRPVDLHQLATDSVRAWLPFAERHGVRLLPPPPTAPAPVVIADPARLAQASGNLIANAVEHGGGVVQVRCRSTAGAVRLEVVDDGPGIRRPVAEIVGGEGARRRGHGLAVADAVAVAHGGRLIAVAAPGGARLVLELPAPELRPQPAAVIGSPQAGSSDGWSPAMKSFLPSA